MRATRSNAEKHCRSCVDPDPNENVTHHSYRPYSGEEVCRGLERDLERTTQCSLCLNVNSFSET